MIELLIGLLILALVIYVAYLVLGMIPLPPNVRQIVTVILAIIFLVVLLRQVGVLAL